MRILLLTGLGLRSNIVYAHLNKNHKVIGIVIDNTYSRKKAIADKIKRRIKKYGWIKVIGQILFTRIMVPLLKIESKKRTENLLKDRLAKKPSKHFNVLKTNDINSREVHDFILKNNPDLIVVHGTTIIKEETLSILDNRPIINFHVGITPKYRGLHGGYWALYNGDEANFGSTVHFLDKGIDTGAVIKQKRMKPTKHDNFYTYLLLQTIKGLKSLDEAINFIANGGNIKKSENGKKGKFYTQPTISQYLYKRLVYGVK